MAVHLEAVGLPAEDLLVENVRGVGFGGVQHAEVPLAGRLRAARPMSLPPGRPGWPRPADRDHAMAGLQDVERLGEDVVPASFAQAAASSRSPPTPPAPRRTRGRALHRRADRRDVLAADRPDEVFPGASAGMRSSAPIRTGRRRLRAAAGAGCSRRARPRVTVSLEQRRACLLGFPHARRLGHLVSRCRCGRGGER